MPPMSGPHAPSRWLVVVMCLYSAGSTGLMYLFSVYSGALKKQFELTQAQLESISTVLFLAGAVSVFPGMVVDRVGPRLGVRLGGGLMAVTFGAQYLVCTEFFPPMPKEAVVSVMCFLAAFQFLGSATVTASVFPTLSALFQGPGDLKGFVVGSGKAWVGLFGAIVTQIYASAVGEVDDSPETFRFLLFLAVGALVLTLGPSFVVTKTPVLTTTFTTAAATATTTTTARTRALAALPTEEDAKNKNDGPLLQGQTRSDDANRLASGVEKKGGSSSSSRSSSCLGGGGGGRGSYSQIYPGHAGGQAAEATLSSSSSSSTTFTNRYEEEEGRKSAPTGLASAGTAAEDEEVALVAGREDSSEEGVGGDGGGGVMVAVSGGSGGGGGGGSIEWQQPYENRLRFVLCLIVATCAAATAAALTSEDDANGDDDDYNDDDVDLDVYVDDAGAARGVVDDDDDDDRTALRVFFFTVLVALLLAPLLTLSPSTLWFGVHTQAEVKAQGKHNALASSSADAAAAAGLGATGGGVSRGCDCVGEWCSCNPRKNYEPPNPLPPPTPFSSSSSQQQHVNGEESLGRGGDNHTEAPAVVGTAGVEGVQGAVGVGGAPGARVASIFGSSVYGSGGQRRGGAVAVMALAGEYTTREMMASFRCWCFLWCTVCVIGGGVMVTSNAAQMMDAVGGKQGAAATAVTLFSVAQSMGRLLSGMSTDGIRQRFGLPTVSVLVGVTSTMAAAHALMASANGPGMIYAGVTLCGFGFGAVWPLMVVVAGEFFGQRNLGANYSFFDGLSSAAAGLFFGLLLPSSVYEAHQNSDGDCFHPQCFRLTYVVICGLNTVAVAAATLLTVVAAQRDRDNSLAAAFSSSAPSSNEVMSPT